MSAVTDRVFSLVSLSTALGCGLVAGIFFAFSNFVMPAIARQPEPSALATMRTINVVVLNWGFLGLFVGTGLGCVVLIALGAMHWEDTSSKLACAGALAYLVGTIGVTRGFNIPLNESLAAGSDWSSFYAPWMAWNHVRTAAALLAATLVTVAILTRQVTP